jgi:hemerythrin
MSALSEKIYGAGHANLDRDHEVLLQIVGELKNLPADSPRLERIGAELLAYLDAHFEDEERL